MYEIVSKKKLNKTVEQIDVYAPFVAAKAEAGQFIILRPFRSSERIPLTVAGYNRQAGTVSVIYQIVGATTLELSTLVVGDSLADFVGPLGNATEIEGADEVCIVGGGVGCAIALPVARKYSECGKRVVAILGFRTKELVILEEEFRAVCSLVITVTDDGSYGEKGNVCTPLSRLLGEGYSPDRIMAIGPIVMMKFVAELAKAREIPSVVSMNPIMIDGTGMCGGCRLTLIEGGERVTKFACVDGPEFDGAKVDFDEALRRGATYREFERHKYESACNLLKKAEGENE